MPALLIREVPRELHEKIRHAAKENRRSLSEEVINLLQQALAEQRTVPREPPTPVKRAFPLTDEWLEQAKNEGRS